MYKFHGNWLHCYKTILWKASVIVYAYRQVYASKSSESFFKLKSQLDALIQVAYILVEVWSICSWSIPVNRIKIKPVVFCRKCLNWHKWMISSRNACELINRIMYFLAKNTRRYNYEPKLYQNAALSLNGMHLNMPWIECWTLCRAAISLGTDWMGTAYARSHTPWVIL